jgi:hypothetical protein
MNANVIIKKASDGTTRLNAQIGVGSSRSFRLMERDEITLIFTLAAPVVLALGDYAIVPEAFVEPSEAGSLQARMYEVTELSHPEYVAASGGYRYELKLEAQYRKWRHKICRYMPLTGGQETSWNLTAYPEVHMQMIVDNVNRLAGLHPSYKYNREGMWTVAVGSDVKHEAKLIQYDGTNILDALAAIAEVYECEWWVDGSVIHLGKCQYGSDTDAVVLEEGVNIDPPVRSDSTESYVTRVIPFGSTRNISRRYRRHLIFTATSMENTGGGYLIRDDARPLQERWFADTLTRTPQAATVEISYSYVPTSWDDSSITLYNSKSSQQYRKELLVQDVNMATHCKWRAKLSGTLEVMVNSWDYASAKNLYSPPHLGYTAVLTAIDSQTGDRVILGGKAVSLAVKDAINGKDFTGHNTATFNFDFPSIEVDNRSGRYSQFRVLFVLKASTSATASLNCTIANGELNFEATPQSGSLKIGGITVEVLDEHNEVAATYTNAVLNPNWAELVADRSEIFLPASSDFTPQSGMRFRIPQLREALVPASYFTSRYAAMEEYGSVVTGSIVTSRLMLPEGHAGYIDVYPDQPEVECVEDVVVFEDVYPRTNCTIEQVESFDDYAEFTNENGEQGKEKYTAYRIADSLFKRANRFKSDWQIEGEKLEVIFQTGALAGMTFEVEPDTDTDRTRTWWKIVRDSETMLPNSLLKPAKGDKFVLSGFDIAAVDETLVGNAEEELLEKAKEYVAKMNTDPSTYEVTVWAAPLLADPPMVLAVGRTVSLKSRTAFGQDAAGAQRSRVSRIIGYDIPLDIPYDNPVYIIGEKAAYSRMGAIEDSVEALRIAQLGGASSVSGATGAGYGFGSYVVHRDDTTPLSDTNVMSSLRSMLEFASRRTAQTLSHLWTFLSGARFGSFLSGESGAMIDGAGNAEVETLRVRGEAEVDRLNAGRQLTVGDYVPGGTGGAMWVDENGEMHIETAHLVVNRRMSVKELEVAERTHVGGSQCISPAGMVCTAVEELTDSNGWRCYFDGSDDTGRRITNDFRVGDLARCETFNLEEADGMLNNRYYWRRVTATGITDEDAQGNRFCYIDLSDEQGEKDPASSCAPAVGDNIVTMGSDTHPERSNLIVASSYGSGTPSIIMFHGIRTFSLQQKDIIGMGMDAAKGIPYFNCYGDFRVGARKGEPGSYIDYDTTTGELNVKARINALSTITDTSGNESSIGQYITDTANELLVVEYSATGADGTWHSTYTNGDRYMRQSSDGGNTWSGAMLITAQDVTITNQSVEYATSASGTTAPTAGWSTTIPSVAEGQYLWTRTTLTFSDGNSVVSYSVSRQGVDGNSGSDYAPNLVEGGKGPLTLNGTKWFKLELANGDISKGDKFALSLGSIRHISGDARYFLAIIQGYVDGVYNDNLLKYTYRLTTENATCVWEAKEDLHKVTGARLTLYSGEGFANAQTNTIEFDYISLTRSNAPMPWVPAASEMLAPVITSQSVTYAKSTTAAQPSDASFTYSSISAANPAKGDYLWTKTVVNYSDGTSTKSYTVSRLGADGSDGTPGAQGADGKTQYTHIAYAQGITAGALPHPTAFTKFQTTAFDGAEYIGFCQDFNEPDPTAHTSYEWSEYKGKDGAGYTPNLLKGTQEVTVNNSYAKIGFDEPQDFLNGEKYTVSVEGIENLIGSATEYSVVLFRNAGGDLSNGILCPVVTLTKEKPYATMTLYSTATKENKVELFLYAGKHGSTVGNSVKYTKVMLSKGDNPMPWVPAASEMVGKDAPYTVFQWAKGDYAQPTGTWSDTPLNALPGEFVWMREGVVTPPATTPVWKNGYTRVTGDTGAAGTNYTPNMLTNSKDNKIHVVEKDSDSSKEWRNSTVHLEYKKTYTISARTNAAAFTGDHQDALVSHPDACALWICSAKGSPQGLVNEVVSSADMATDGSKGSVFTWMKPTAGYFLRTNFYKSGTWYVNHVKIEEGDNPNPSWTPHPDEMVGTPGTNGINGQDVFLLDLDNEVVAVTCDADGNVISGLPATINARVFKGGTEVTSGVTYRNQGTTLTVSQSGNKFEIKGIGKDRDTLVIEAVVAGLTLRSTVNVYKVKAGADGAPATMYFLEPAESSVTRTAQGGLSVASLGCRKLYVTGSDQRHLTTANTLTAQIYTNGVAGTETVIAADGVTNNGVVTLTDDTTAVVFTLYKGASTAEADMLDRERVPVLTDAFGLSVGGVNLLRKTNSGIINWTTNTSSNGQIVMEPGTPQSRCVFYNNATTAAPDWQMIGFALPADTIKANCYYMLSFKARVLQSNGTAGGASTQPLQLRWQISKSTGGDRLTNVESRTVTYTETRFTIMMRTTGVPTSQHRLWGYISTTGTAWKALEIWDMQLEEGVVATEYKASPLDFNYLTEALKESTTVEGGVILSSLMRLGYTASDAYRVTAGMNGVLAPSTDGTDPAIWAGGDMLDATSDENSSADLDSLAKLMFRHNGNGYMCGGVVRVLDGRILIGRNRKADGTIKSDAEFAQDCIILDEEGLTYVSGGQDRLLVTSAQVGDTFETKVNAVNWSGTATAFDSIALAHYYSKEMILEPVNPEQTASEDGTEALSTTYLETWSWVPTINIAQTKTINIGSGTIAVGTVIEVSSLSTSFSITRSHSEGVQITATAELCYTDSAGKVQVVRKVNMPKQYSGNTCSFSMGTTIRHTVQVAASYFVRLTLTPNTDGIGKPLANEYKTVTPATATASGTTKTTRSDVTIIGTDGIKSIWGDGGFLANRNGVKIRGSLWINGKLVTTS